MSKGRPSDGARGNRLLGAMEAASLARIAPHLEPVVLELSDVVCEAGGVLKHAYFPQGAVSRCSPCWRTARPSRPRISGAKEPSACSRRCTAGSPLTDVWCNSRAAWFAARLIFVKSEFELSERVRNLFVSYSETLLSQVQQTVACNALRSTEERMCRWLLMMHDRAEGEALPYTHEFLSHMLGANRKSVTLAAQSLQAAGLISYSGGRTGSSIAPASNRHRASATPSSRSGSMLF
jgi:Crp-like helix-turn-helix domain